MRSIIKCPYYYFESALTDDFCDLIISQGKELEQIEGTLNSDSTSDSSFRRGKVAWIEDNWITKVLNAYVEQANKYANWNFILTDKEQVQFAIYKKGDFYDYHRDCDIVQLLYRKLSVTVQLSDPETYRGGDLFIRHFWGETNLPIDEQLKSRGTVIVFPSILLHSVTRLTGGTRYSLVQWSQGEKLV